MPEVPFARLPRLDRLKVAGKYDATEEPESDEEGEGESGEEGIQTTEGGKKELKERVKKKMRGKNKSMKRLAILCFQFQWNCADSVLTRYLRKHRKNVIDPQTVRPFTFVLLLQKGPLIHVAEGRDTHKARKATRRKAACYRHRSWARSRRWPETQCPRSLPQRKEIAYCYRLLLLFCTHHMCNSSLKLLFD